MKFDLHGGTVTTEVFLDAADDPLNGTLDATFEQLDLAEILDPFTDLDSDELGVLNGNLDITLTQTDPTALDRDILFPYLGTLKIKESRFTYVNSSKDSDLSGDIRIDTAGEKPDLTADLSSINLDFDDLSGLVGAAPGTGPDDTASPAQKRKAAREAGDEKVLPEEPYEMERLQAMNAAVAYRAKKVNAPDLPLDEVDIDFNLKGGGRAKYWFQGISMADLLGSADGGAYLLMTGGRLDSLLSARSPLHITGSFESPDVFPDRSALIVRGATALGLGLAAGPAAILPLLETGTADEPALCQGMIESIKEAQ